MNDHEGKSFTAEKSLLEIKASEERYRAFISQSNEGIWLFELERPIPITLPVEEQTQLAFEIGYLAECNDAMARQYGFTSASEITGVRLGDLLVPDDPNNYAFVRAFIESGYNLSEAESHETDRDGNDRYFLNNLVGVIEDGNFLRAWGTQRDVTEAKKLEKSTAHLASIVTTSEDAIISKDINGIITSWNLGAQHMFGYTADEMIGTPVITLIPDHLKSEEDLILAKIRNGERVEHYETIRRRKDGTELNVSLTISPLYDTTGKIIGASKIGRDITQQKAAEAIADRYRLLSMRARDIILFLDSETGSIVEANRSAAEAYGYEYEKLCTLNIRDLRAPETWPVMEEQYRTADGQGTQFETVHLRADGTRFPVEVSAVGADVGSKRMIVSIVRDITERKEHDAAMSQNQLMLALAMRSARMGVLECDIPSDTVWWSEELEEIFGLEKGEFRGNDEHFLSLIHEDDREKVWAAIEKAVAEHRDYAVEFRFYHSDGSIRWMEGRGEAVYSQKGDPVRIYGMGIDITSRKRIEEERRANEDRYRSLFDSIDQGFCVIEMIFDPAGKPVDYRFIEVNQAFERETGMIGAEGRMMREFAPNHEEYWFEMYGNVALTGEPVRFEHYSATLGKWFDVHAFHPGTGNRDRVAVLFRDITESRAAAELERESEERQSILLKLLQGQRETTQSVAEITAAAAEAVGTYLKANRVGFFEMEDDDTMAFGSSWTDGMLDPLTGSFPAVSIGTLFLAEVRAGRTLAISDTASDPLTADSSFGDIGARSIIGAPIIRKGRWAGGLYVNHSEPRNWTDEEIDFVRDVADQTWDAAERARAQQELRETEERFSKAFNSSPLVLTISSLTTGKLIEVNDTFVDVTGYSREEAVGRSTIELGLWAKEQDRSPELDQVRTGGQVRNVEYDFVVRDGTTIVGLLSAERIEIGGEQYALTVIQDITERRRTQVNQDFLFRFGEIVREYEDADSLTMAVAEAVGRHFGLDRCFFNAVDVISESVTIRSEFRRDELPPLAGTVSLAVGSPETRRQIAAGQNLVVQDSRTDARTGLYTEPYEKLGMRAFTAIPLMRHGRWTATLVAAVSEPRTWQDWEVELLQTVAERTWLALEKTRSESILRESEQRYRSLANAMPQLVWTANADGSVDYYNMLAAKYDGIDFDSDTSKWNWNFVVHPGDRQQTEQAWADAVSTGHYEIEHRIRLKDGTFRWHLSRAVLVQHASGMGVHKWFGTATDIHDLKTAQEAVFAAERRAADEYLDLLSRIVPLAEALGTARDLVTVYTAVRDFVRTGMPCSAFFVSFYDPTTSVRSAAYAWGEEGEVDVSTLPPMVLREEDGGPNSQAVFQRRAAIVSRYMDAMRGHPHVILQENGINPNSSVAVPMIVMGRVTGTIEVQAYEENAFNEEHVIALEMVSNLTAVAIENVRLLEIEGKARTEAEAANRMKDEFLSILSHELRTPLNAILGWVRMLRAGMLDEERSEKALEVIERNTRQQSSLIEDLLDVSRIISGKMRIEKELVDLTSIVQEAADSMRPLAAAKSIKFTTELAAEPLRMNGDSVRLLQLVTNLVQNAFKFTAAGGTVTLVLTRDVDGAKLIIADTGVGIEKEFLPNIFDRFSQADASTQRNYTGLGLGLTIVKTIVQLHGGSIDARSDGQNKGASFTVKLPLEAEAGTVGITGNGAADGSDESSLLQGMRILLVDDHAESMMPLQLLLERKKAEVICALSAEEALDHLNASTIDLLISDIGMPANDGYDLINRVRTIASQNMQIPAIALTGYASEEDRNRALSAGYQMHLVKPLDYDEVLQVVKTIYDQKKNGAA